MKLQFRSRVLEELLTSMDRLDSDEMGIPSYLHRNPLIRWLLAKRVGTVLECVDLTQCPTVLDFGCGVGMLLLQTPPRSLAYTGVDILLDPAQTCLQAHGREDLKLLAAEDWLEDIKDGTLDYIVAQEVLEHVEDVPDLIGEFRRKLKPGGSLVVSGPTENHAYRLGRWIAGYSGEYHHRNIYDIMGDIEASGFTRVRRSRLPLPGPLSLFLVTEYQMSE